MSNTRLPPMYYGDVHGAETPTERALAREAPPRLDEASFEARERLHRVAQAPLPNSAHPWGEITCTPQPEGTPAMQGNDEQSKDESTLPALINELEELNSELQCELQCLDGAVDRLSGSEPEQGAEINEVKPAPETHLARLHHQIICLRNLRDETRELNRRLAEAV